MALYGTEDDRDKDAYGVAEANAANAHIFQANAHASGAIIPKNPHTRRPKSHNGAIQVPMEGDDGILPPQSDGMALKRNSDMYLGISLDRPQLDPNGDVPPSGSSDLHPRSAIQTETWSSLTNGDSGGEEETHYEDAFEVLESIEDFVDANGGYEYRYQDVRQKRPPSSNPTTIVRPFSPSQSLTERGSEGEEPLDDVLPSTVKQSADQEDLLDEQIWDTAEKLGAPPDNVYQDLSSQSLQEINNDALPHQDQDGIIQGDLLSLDLLSSVQGQTQPEASVEDFSKLIRKLRKQVGQVLLKRTQWQQEYQSVQASRNWLHDSTTELKNALQSHPAAENLQSSPGAKKKRKKRKKAKRPETLVEPESPQDESISSSMKDNSDAGTSEISLDLGGSVESSPTAHSGVNIKNHFDRYLNDFQTLENQEDQERKSMEDLSNWEYHLEELLKAIEVEMRAPDFAHKLTTETLMASNPSSESTSQVPSEASLEPELEEYFEVQGSIGVFLERLGELDYEHSEGLLEREFSRDHQEEVKVSDDDFENDYKEARITIERDLDAARSNFAIVTEKCKVAGLDPELYRNAEKQVAFETPHLLSGKGRKSSRMAGSTAPGPSSSAIEGWLRTVPDTAASGENNLPTEDTSAAEMSEEQRKAEHESNFDDLIQPEGGISVS